MVQGSGIRPDRNASPVSMRIKSCGSKSLRRLETVLASLQSEKHSWVLQRGDRSMEEKKDTQDTAISDTAARHPTVSPCENPANHWKQWDGSGCQRHQVNDWIISLGSEEGFWWERAVKAFIWQDKHATRFPPGGPFLSALMAPC